MKIGIIGGTGGMGKGFALRWCKKHEVIIGSRDAERAITAANEYLSLAKDAYVETLMEQFQGRTIFQLQKNQMF